MLIVMCKFNKDWCLVSIKRRIYNAVRSRIIAFERSNGT